jgi:hypothetical protein
LQRPSASAAEVLPDEAATAEAALLGRERLRLPPWARSIEPLCSNRWRAGRQGPQADGRDCSTGIDADTGDPQQMPRLLCRLSPGGPLLPCHQLPILAIPDGKQPIPGSGQRRPEGHAPRKCRQRPRRSRQVS